MGLRELSRGWSETIDREVDERARAIGAQLAARALGAGLLVAILGTFVLLLVPLPEGLRLPGFGLLLLVVLNVCAAIFGAGARRRRVFGPEVRRAITGKVLLWTPAAVLPVALLSLALGRPVVYSALDAVTMTLALLVAGAVQYWVLGLRR